EIRAVLLAALRAAVLWRQLGGSLWDFLLGRRAMLEAIEQALSRAARRRLRHNKWARRRVFRGLPPPIPEHSHGRLLRHPRPPRRRRQIVLVLQPAQAGRALRPGAAALLDEDPAGEPAAPRGRRDGAAGAHRGGGGLGPEGGTGDRDRVHAGARAAA